MSAKVCMRLQTETDLCERSSESNLIFFLLESFSFEDENEYE